MQKKSISGPSHSSDGMRARMQMLLSVATTLIFIWLLCHFFPPRWAANDDVGMSMVAHGYGIAAIKSPNIVFSNVLWGYFVGLIPEINGVLGYSLATFGSLAASCAAIVYCLLRNGSAYPPALIGGALLFTGPIIFPDFTLNAGMLMAAAMLCWHVHDKKQDLALMVLGCVLALTSFLIRSQECLLVLATGLPLLSLRSLSSTRSAKLLLVSLAALGVIVTAVDYGAYQAPEWRNSNEVRDAIRPFVDFRAGPKLKARPDILAKYGYSENDIDLISDWFFVDSKIYDAAKLNAMREELGPLSDTAHSLDDAWEGLHAVADTKILMLSLAALLLTLILPSRRTMICWAIFLAAISIFGWLGRPGVLRVYIPMLAVIMLSCLLSTGKLAWQRTGVVVILLVLCGMNMEKIFARSQAQETAAKKIRVQLTAFPAIPVVNWGTAFPFEDVYRVLGASNTAMQTQLYSLGAFTLAPFSVSYREQLAGRGMTEKLREEGGMPIIAGEAEISLLSVYCKEHLAGNLKEIEAREYGAVRVSWRRCARQ